MSDPTYTRDPEKRCAQCAFREEKACKQSPPTPVSNSQLPVSPPVENDGWCGQWVKHSEHPDFKLAEEPET